MIVELDAILDIEIETFLTSKASWCEYLSSDRFLDFKLTSFMKNIYVRYLVDTDSNKVVGFCLSTLVLKKEYSDTVLFCEDIEFIGSVDNSKGILDYLIWSKKRSAAFPLLFTVSDQESVVV